MSRFDLTSATNLFKIKYGKLSENVYNSATPLHSRVIKKYDFVGKQIFEPIPLSFSGGVGSGSLPLYNTANYEDCILTAKKVYATTSIDRESIYAADSDEGAFVRTTKEAVQKAVESYMRNDERIWFNDGTGSLGTGDNSTNLAGDGTTGTPFSVVISAATWKEANWEEKDYVNYASETTRLEVVSVDPATRTIELVGTSAGLTGLIGAPVPGIFYMQGSKDNDPYGLKLLDLTSGSAYTIPITRRWRASVQEDKSGAGLTTDMMNEATLEIRRKCGKDPNLIITSYTQMRKLLNLLEDQKEYQIEPRSKDLKGKISFKAIEFYSQAGPMPVVAARFCEDDRMYFLNDNFLKVRHRPGHGWFSDDGTVFLRDADSDSYSARYGGYKQNFIALPFHGFIDGLAT